MYRGTDFIADTVGHIASERPLIIVGDADQSESGPSIAELNIPTGCNHRAAV